MHSTMHSAMHPVSARLLCAAGFVLWVCLTGGGTARAQQPIAEPPFAAGPYANSDYAGVEFVPEAIYPGETARLVVEYAGSADFLEMEFGPRQMRRSGAEVSTLRLVDDGTRGDAAAGDHLFTADGLDRALPAGVVFEARSYDPAAQPTYAVVGGARTRIGTAYRGPAATLRVLGPEVEAPARHWPRSGAAVGKAGAASPAFDMVVGGNVISVVTEYDPDDVDDMYGSAVESTRRIYEVYPDDFDHLINVFYTRSIGGLSFNGSNRIPGLGLSLYDGSQRYGSQGRLDSWIAVNEHVSFDLMTHELLHNWAAYFGEPVKIADGGHWLPFPRTESGFGPTNAIERIEPVGNGEYAVYSYPLEDVAPDRGYVNSLELYLMGLAPKEEVEDVTVLVDPSFVRSEFTRGRIVHYWKASGTETYTIEDVVRAHGERPQTTPSVVHAGFVVHKDRLLTTAELAYYNLVIDEYAAPSSSLFFNELNYAMATRGRGRIDFSLPGPVATEPPPSVPRRGVVAYPNPSRGWVRVTTERGGDGVRVVDVLGREVMHLDGPIAASFDLDLSGLAPGVYTVSIRSSRRARETAQVVVYR